jgi:hypothetical protein
MIRRPRRLAVILISVGVFLAISFLLARWLSLESAERSDVLALLNAEARGDASGMLAQLYHCDRRCRRDVLADARTLRRPGKVLILAYQSQTAYALTSRVADTRVAWRVGKGLPIVQCITVSRKGNAISGLSLHLLAVGPSVVPTTNDCAPRYDG